MVRGSYLLGCRVSELCRLRWEDIEPLDEGGNVRLLGKGSKTRTIRVSTDTWRCSSRWAAALLRTGSFQVIKGMGH